MQNSSIFPLFYLPPISYVTVISNEKQPILLEKFEFFPKQTYRNRATILSPNGSLDLIIPVVKGSKVHTIYKDVKISYDSNWQRLHWLSLQNCYRSSAYFEYYEDELATFYHKKYNYLFEFNLELMTWLMNKLKLSFDYSCTEEYNSIEGDYRSSMTKSSIPLIATPQYFQVFSDRNKYINNPSCIDLLFNQGPQAKNILKF